MQGVAMDRFRRGFSLMEAMVSASVLGIALAALVRAHASSIQGTSQAEDLGRASEIARQIGDLVATQPMDQLPACGAVTDPVPVAPAGCRASLGPGTVMAASKGSTCTRLVNQDGLVDASTGLLADAASGTEQYRIDMIISQHPNGSTDLGVLHVWVCWRDMTGNIHQTYTTRTKKVGFW